MTIVRVDIKGSYNIPRDKMWRLIDLHRDEATCKLIHPDMISQKLVHEEGEQSGAFKAVTVLDRETRFRGKIWRATWRFDVSPPEKLRYEVISSDGPMAKGSYLENTYSEVSGGTVIRTNGEVIVQGIPSFLAGWAVKRALNKIDKEDLDYIKRTRL